MISKSTDKTKLLLVYFFVYNLKNNNVLSCCNNNLLFTRSIWAVDSKTKIAQNFIYLVQKVMTVQKPQMIVAIIPPKQVEHSKQFCSNTTF